MGSCTHLGVLRHFCSTNFPFDPPMQSVTFCTCTTNHPTLLYSKTSMRTTQNTYINTCAKPCYSCRYAQW